MTDINLGTYGAKVQSWRDANPRALLSKIITENRKWSKDKVLSAFKEALLEDGLVFDTERYVESIIEYWFANNYPSLVERPAADSSVKRTKVAQIKASIKKRIRREAQMILLDMVMPNGKALRACTGRDCSKLGGWYTKIAGKLKPSEIVGEVLSEAQLRKLYGR